MWSSKASAQVRVVDSAVLDDAMARADADALVIPITEDEHGEVPTDDAVAGLDRVGWLLWPMHGMDEVLECDAVVIREVATDVEAESDTAGLVTWSVTVKLRDVAALRRIATEARPEARDTISESLAVAWQSAIDVFAPIRSIPGITWEPGPVEVRHHPARATER